MRVVVGVLGLAGLALFALGWVLGAVIERWQEWRERRREPSLESFNRRVARMMREDLER